MKRSHSFVCASTGAAILLSLAPTLRSQPSQAPGQSSEGELEADYPVSSFASRSASEEGVLESSDHAEVFSACIDVSADDVSAVSVISVVNGFGEHLQTLLTLNSGQRVQLPISLALEDLYEGSALCLVAEEELR